MAIVRNRVSRSGSLSRSLNHHRAWPLAEILEGRQLLATILVNTTGDADGADNSRTLSLRQAIEISNGTLALSSLSASQAGLVVGGLTTRNTIDFDIPGAGPFTIEPTSALPAITSPAVINGYSEPGAQANTNGPRQGMNPVILIELNGARTSGANGLQIQAGQSTVEGLAIGGFTAPSTSTQGGIGILLQAETGDLIQGNLIGTDITGTRPLPNGGDGIKVESNDNTIGGTTPGARNIISGNLADGLDITGSYELVEGNFIGTDSTGARALPNASGIGLNSSSQNTIGGTASGAGNVISGSALAGIDLASNINYLFIPGLSSTSTDNLIEGNFIGTNAAGSQALPNGTGINLDASDSNTIGGTAAGAGNIISGNLGDGIDFSSVSVVEGAGTIEAGYFYVSSNDNRIEGNLIGTDPTETIALGNGGDGISIGGGSNNTIGATSAGAGNVIAFNGGSGTNVIALYSASGTAAAGPDAVNDAISGNSIFANGKLGIDLGGDGVTSNNPAGSPSGPNLDQPYPVITSATPAPGGTLISATLDALPSTSYNVEFFANPAADPSGFGQGKTYLGSAVATADAGGHASFSFPFAQNLIGQSISATATDPKGNTSEFARAVSVGYMTTTRLIGPGQVATLGRPTTFAAVVGSTAEGIPSGQVNFLQDGVVIGSAPLNASGVAVFITRSLSPGLQTITAAYVGDSTHASSPSTPVAIGVFAPHAFGGPAVTSVAALGPNQVTIGFNRGLLPGPAEEAANYQIVGPGQHAITVETALYDPKAARVTLTTLQNLTPAQTDQLTINGQTGDRIVDVFGIPLNGQKNGKPGHNYVGQFTVKKPPVVKVAHPSGPKPKLHAKASLKDH